MYNIKDVRGHNGERYQIGLCYCDHCNVYAHTAVVNSNRLIFDYPDIILAAFNQDPDALLNIYSGVRKFCISFPIPTGI